MQPSSAETVCHIGLPLLLPVHISCYKQLNSIDFIWLFADRPALQFLAAAFRWPAKRLQRCLLSSSTILLQNLSCLKSILPYFLPLMTAWKWMHRKQILLVHACLLQIFGQVLCVSKHICPQAVPTFAVSLVFQALLPTRRWFNTMLDDSHMVVRCLLSGLIHREEEGHLFCQVRSR